jgi:hypothetical protein
MCAVKVRNAKLRNYLKSSVATLDQSLCQSVETLLRYDGLETKQKSLYYVFV